MAGEGRRDALERALRDAVRDGRPAPGARLPATRRLAVELEVSRGTVKSAYDQLVAEGYLTARQGSDTRVTSSLLLGWGTAGWLLLGGATLVASYAMGPAIRRAPATRTDVRLPAPVN